MEHRACHLDALPDGSMREVDLGGEAVLLARVGGACHAVRARCPHAGGKLAEGVLQADGVVVCPWHKAAFRVDTGERVAPPAVDDLPRYPVRVVGEEVMVSVPAAPRRAAARVGSDARCFVLAGAGAAGAMAAQTLREEGFGGRVVMIGQEDRLPYDRTVLSKYALSGKQGAEKTPLQEAGFYERLGIELVVGAVAAVDPAARAVRLEDGREWGYDAALLATGGVPRELEVPGAALDGVFTLRAAVDAEAIVGAAAGARRAVVVGGGFIGLEAAAALCERGLEVVVATPEREPLEKQLGAEVGAIFRAFHEGKGVRFRRGAKVTALEGDGRVRAVVFEDGTRVPADLVVAGLGVRPATAVLPAGFARREDGGLDVDGQLRAAEGLWAAGDVAAFPWKGARVRVEHWRVAQQHGRVAALNMLGRGVAYEAVPVFWTIHFMQRLDYVGHAAAWDEVVVEGDRGAPSFTATYVKDGRVAALAGWGRDRQMAGAVGLMEGRRDWGVGALAEALRGWR